MMYSRDLFLVSRLLLKMCLLAFLFTACNQVREDSTPTTVPESKKFKARYIQKALDQVYDIEVVPVGQVKSKTLPPPVKTLRKSNSMEAGDPVSLGAITPIITTPGEGQYKKPEVVPFVDTPHIGKPPQSILAGSPQLLDMNPASIGSFNSLHGLRMNLVFAVHQDRQGNIWLGTYGGGVVRYDGKYMTTYSEAEGLPGSAFTKIRESRDGTLWFGSAIAGITSITGYDGKYYRTLTPENGLVSSGIGNFMVDHEDNLWVCTLGGISKFDGKQFTNFTEEQGLFSNTVRTSLVAADGQIWFGMQGGICRYDGSQFYTYRHPALQNMGWNNDMIEDLEGHIWISTTKGILCFDGEFLWDYSTSGLPQNSIHDFFEDSQGNLWFCTKNGIYQYTPAKETGKSTITHLDVDDGLNDNDITCGMQDNRGNYWFGTNNRGVNVYQGPIFQHLDISKIRSLSIDQSNQVWVATFGNGIYSINQQEINQLTVDQDLSFNFGQTVYSSLDGSVWIGTWGAGVDHLDKNTLRNYRTSDGLITNNIFCITQDHEANIWIGSTGGLTKFDGKTFTNYRSELGVAWDIFEDSRHRIWISQGINLMMLDGNQITEYLTVHDLGVAGVTQVVEDERGNLWMTTIDGGIFCLVDDYFYQFTREQGLSTSTVFGAIVAKEGEIYTVNNHGLNRITISPNPSERDFISIKSYLHSDGFLGVGGFPNSIHQDASGIIWIGTYDRVTIFDPQVDLKDTIPPSVQLRNILVFNQAIDWSGVLGKQDSTVTLDNGVPFRNFNFDGLSRWNFVPENLQLSPDNNYLTFQFIGITPRYSDKVRYQYFLEGLDKRWSTVQETSEASYNNLPHGHYTFKVKAVNRDGYWSDELNYAFSIRPPWWYSTTAYLFYGLLFIFAIWLVHIYQRKRVIRIERMKAQKKEIAQAREIEKAYKELKLTQAQLIQSEKMASLGELTAGIAHEIQNPLNFVNNFSEVNQELFDELESEIEKGNKEEVTSILNNLRENEKKVIQHGKRADVIVKSMLQHSRTSTGEKELTDINALCNEYLKLAYHGLRARDKSFNAELKTELDPDLPKIEVVPQDIGRVMLNILNNAFHAVQDLENAKISVSTKFLNDQIEILISDNGAGIPNEIKDKIFQPFFTTKPTGQGTGLGLSLSYDIVKAHGGEIAVDSTKDIGTEFKISLPVNSSI